MAPVNDTVPVIPVYCGNELGSSWVAPEAENDVWLGNGFAGRCASTSRHRVRTTHSILPSFIFGLDQTKIDKAGVFDSKLKCHPQLQKENH